VTGWPVSTMVRGKFVVRDGKLVGARTDGAYVSRAKSPYAAPSGKLPTAFAPAGEPKT
jgi:dihydropyrimidinase